MLGLAGYAFVVYGCRCQVCDRVVVWLLLLVCIMLCLWLCLGVVACVCFAAGYCCVVCVFLFGWLVMVCVLWVVCILFVMVGFAGGLLSWFDWLIPSGLGLCCALLFCGLFGCY